MDNVYTNYVKKSSKHRNKGPKAKQTINKDDSIQYTMLRKST